MDRAGLSKYLGALPKRKPPWCASWRGVGGVDTTYLVKSTLFVNSFSPYGLLPTLAQSLRFLPNSIGLYRRDSPEVNWYEAAGVARKEFKIKHPF
jgi:hypothetical protein